MPLRRKDRTDEAATIIQKIWEYAQGSFETRLRAFLQKSFKMHVYQAPQHGTARARFVCYRGA